MVVMVEKHVATSIFNSILYLFMQGNNPSHFHVGRQNYQSDQHEDKRKKKADAKKVQYLSICYTEVIFLPANALTLVIPIKKTAVSQRVLIHGYYQQLKNGSLRTSPEQQHLLKMKNKTSQSQETRTHLFYFSVNVIILTFMMENLCLNI